MKDICMQVYVRLSCCLNEGPQNGFSEDPVNVYSIGLQNNTTKTMQYNKEEL